MKKLFSLLTIALLTMSAWAASSVTIDFSTQGYTNAQDFDGQTITINGVSMTFNANGGTTPKYYTSGTSMRLYANNTMTVAAENNITSIEFTFSQGGWANNSANSGTYADGVWGGEATNIIFTNNTGAQVRIQKMVVTFDGETPGPGPDPDPESNVFAPVTNVNDLAAGDKIILVGFKDDAAFAMGDSRGNNFGGVDVTITDGKIVTDLANVITLEAADANWNLKTAQGYLYAASSTSNQMKLETPVDTLGNANAAITIDGDSAIIVFQGTNERNIVRFNSTNNPVLFSCYGATNNQKPVYIYKATGEIIDITEVAKPVFDPSGRAFVGSQEVAITCATEGATIYYALNDGEYEVYEAPFTVTETTTVKAYAELNGTQSEVATATYTKRVEVATLAEANNLENKTDFVFYGNVVVVYQNGSNLWVKDDSGYGLIYGSQVPEFAEGTVLNEEWEAQHYLFRGTIHEYQYPYNVTASEEPLQTIEANEYTEAQLTTDNINERVIVKGLTLTTAEDPKYLYTADGMAIYNQFNITYPTIEEGKAYDVEGMVSYYNNAVQIMPIAVTEAEGTEFIRGDVDGDGEVAIGDVTTLIDLMLNNASDMPAAADCNLDNEVGIGDVTALIDFLLTNQW